MVGLWDCRLSQRPWARAEPERTGCGERKSAAAWGQEYSEEHSFHSRRDQVWDGSETPGVSPGKGHLRLRGCWGEAP